MTKTAKEILERVYSLGSKAQQSATPKAVDTLGERVVENNLKELEAIMLEVIGNDTPIDPNALFVLQAEKLAQNELRKHQRNRMRSALYGEEKS